MKLNQGLKSNLNSYDKLSFVLLTLLTGKLKPWIYFEFCCPVTSDWPELFYLNLNTTPLLFFDGCRSLVKRFDRTCWLLDPVPQRWKEWFVLWTWEKLSLSLSLHQISSPISNQAVINTSPCPCANEPANCSAQCLI